MVVSQDSAPKRRISPSPGFAYGTGPATGAERLRISWYGHRFHWSLDSVPRFRAFVCRNSAYDRYGRADFNIVLDQHIGRSTARAFGGGMAPAIAAFYHEPRLFGVTAVLGGRVSFQCGRSPTLGASAAPNAFYRLGGDKRRLLLSALPLQLAGPRLATDIGLSSR